MIDIILFLLALEIFYVYTGFPNFKREEILMKKMIILGVIVFSLVGVAAVFAAGPPTTDVVIDACKTKMSAVTFPHPKHAGEMKIACTTCHHSGLKACKDCHGKTPAAGAASCTEMAMNKNPFHVRCIGCHKAQGKGPTSCKECHK